MTIHSLRSNRLGARREGGSVAPAILDRRSNEAPGQFQRNPKGGMSFVRRRCYSLLTDPLRDMRVARASSGPKIPRRKRGRIYETEYLVVRRAAVSRQTSCAAFGCPSSLAAR